MHLALVALCFGGALYSYSRAAFAPVIVFLVDLPLSLLLKPLSRMVASTLCETLDLPGARGVSFLVDAILFGSAGTAWYFGIGLAIQSGLRAFSRTK